MSYPGVVTNPEGFSPGAISITPDLDETLRRITDTKNIAGVIIVNSEGVTVKSTLDNTLTGMVSCLSVYLEANLTSFCQKGSP